MCPPASTSPTSENDPTSGAVGRATAIPDCVPYEDLSQAAYKYAASHLHPIILNHSIRVFLYAKAIAEREGSSWINTGRIPFLFTACTCHDLGTTIEHDGTQRFEVEGADAAVNLCRQHGASEADAHEVWVAIALHTSPGIAERISELARLVRLGVTIDFKRTASMALTNASEVEEIEGRFPRGEIEKVLSDAVVEQGLRQPEKAPAASWPGVLVRSKRENPGWEGVNKAF